MEEELNQEQEALENESGDETDYKALYEQERAEKEKKQAEADKWKTRFKSTKANENAGTKPLDQETVQKMVNDSVGVVKFYTENKEANQYQQDIEALVAKGIERDKAFRYVIAEKDPTLLLDEAKKAQLAGNTALNGTPGQVTVDPKNLTDEQIAKMSDEDFEKAFPIGGGFKKFYGAT